MKSEKNLPPGVKLRKGKAAKAPRRGEVSHRAATQQRPRYAGTSRPQK
jgi:hypothetical protein